MNTNEQKQIEFEAMQYKAHQNGFNLGHFTGFVLAEIDSPCELHFQNLLDVNNYIDACNLSDSELIERFNLPIDADLPL
jgi:hypothetical protein